jgi:hypothetical protein
VHLFEKKKKNSVPSYYEATTIFKYYLELAPLKVQVEVC